MSNQLEVLVNQDSPRATSEGVWADLKGSKRGEVCVVDFYTAMALEGRIYQVCAGTITAAITGDEAITDTDAEMSADATLGITIIPIEAMITWDAVGGDALECAGKSVGTLSVSGTLFVPLPLKAGGAACRAIGRVDGAGVLQVLAETPTSTRQHFHYSEEFVNDDVNEQAPWNPVVWIPRMPPVLKGEACFYLQMASATTGPLYFAHFNFIELPTVSVS